MLFALNVWRLICGALCFHFTHSVPINSVCGTPSEREHHADVAATVAPGTPPLGPHRGLTVSPRVGTVHATVSRPRVGREAPGWGGPSRREPPPGWGVSRPPGVGREPPRAGAGEPPWGVASAAPKESSCMISESTIEVACGLTV